MKKVKITVLKTTLDKELAAEYGIEGLTACPMLQAGQVFYADYAKPEGLCDEAWKAIYQYVFALAHGAGEAAAATTACAPSSSSWKPPTRRPSSITRRCVDPRPRKCNCKTARPGRRAVCGGSRTGR